MRLDVAALSDCCLAALAAENGHGRRWAVARCVRRLQALPPGPMAAAVDEQSARAMVAVAETINRTACLPRAA